MKIKIKKSGPSRVVLTHGQTIRQSHQYQSIEASFGMTLELTGDTSAEAIQLAYKRIIEEVEAQLASKAIEQRKILRKL